MSSINFPRPLSPSAILLGSQSPDLRLHLSSPCDNTTTSATCSAEQAPRGVVEARRGAAWTIAGRRCRHTTPTSWRGSRVSFLWCREEKRGTRGRVPSRYWYLDHSISCFSWRVLRIPSAGRFEPAFDAGSPRPGSLRGDDKNEAVRCQQRGVLHVQSRRLAPQHQEGSLRPERGAFHPIGPASSFLSSGPRHSQSKLHQNWTRWKSKYEKSKTNCSFYVSCLFYWVNFRVWF